MRLISSTTLLETVFCALASGCMPDRDDLSALRAYSSVLALSVNSSILEGLWMNSPAILKYRTHAPLSHLEVHTVYPGLLLAVASLKLRQVDEFLQPAYPAPQLNQLLLLAPKGLDLGLQVRGAWGNDGVVPDHVYYLLGELVGDARAVDAGRLLFAL